ncbi:MAG: zeta toxin family protein, partial [Bacteroidales bacterium]|nr:zeta toxin family protein [Bacteroidales bacterium]
MLIIGIAGGTGSGKTTVVRKLKNHFKNEDFVVVPQDSYYKDSSFMTPEQKAANNFDHPNSVDFDLLISDIKK